MIDFNKCEHGNKTSEVDLVLYICDQCSDSYVPSNCDICNHKYGNSCKSCYVIKGPEAPPPPFPERYYCNKCKLHYNSLPVYKKHIC
jgi:hypothetical protein